MIPSHETSGFSRRVFAQFVQGAFPAVGGKVGYNDAEFVSGRMFL